MIYNVQGETVEGEFIVFDMDTENLMEVIDHCNEVLTDLGGGHLDIFDEEDQFIDDVEV